MMLDAINAQDFGSIVVLVGVGAWFGIGFWFAKALVGVLFKVDRRD